MNKVFHIATYGEEDRLEDLGLIKIEDFQSYEYFEKKWQETPGLYSMINDPGPWAEHVDENRAKEIMKIIDDLSE